MDVLYITYPWFLDFSLEYIKELSKRVKLHVLVVCPENRKNATIFELDKAIPYRKNAFYTLNDMVGNLKDSDYYEDYVRDCKSFYFSFAPTEWYSWKGFQYNYTLYRFIKKLSPKILHFDDLTIEILWLSLLIRSRKIIIDVHDPIAHSGESNKRRNIIRKFYYPIANAFITFSKHSAKVFKSNYGYDSSRLELVPYTFYDKYSKINPHLGDYILFFGRISSYKGVEDLIQAYTELRVEGKQINLVIAGKSVYGYTIPNELLEIEGIIRIDRFIENKEIASLVSHAKFIVCPYRDATQSGVVMTAFALGKPVITSKVGGLHEPIRLGYGIVYNDISEGLVQAIREMLNHTEDTFPKDEMQQLIIDNVDKLIRIYEKQHTKK